MEINPVLPHSVEKMVPSATCYAYHLNCMHACICRGLVHVDRIGNSALSISSRHVTISSASKYYVGLLTELFKLPNDLFQVKKPVCYSLNALVIGKYVTLVTSLLSIETLQPWGLQFSKSRFSLDLASNIYTYMYMYIYTCT